MSKGHIHAELMLQYAQDAAETKNPNSLWEDRVRGANKWNSCAALSAPAWHPDYEYRRKPRTVTINGIEVPEPMREEPRPGEQYYAVTFESPDGWGWYPWRGLPIDCSRLARGLIHATGEGAKIHAQALLSFSKRN